MCIFGVEGGIAWREERQGNSEVSLSALEFCQSCPYIILIEGYTKKLQEWPPKIIPRGNFQALLYVSTGLRFVPDKDL